MGDVGERAAVHERRGVLQGLHEVGRERVAQQHRDRPVGPEVAGGDRLLGAAVADDDVADPALEVGPRLGEAEDRHQLGGDDDVEAVLARVAVGQPAEADHQVAQRAVVEVEHALPVDRPHVDVERVAVVDVVVDQRRQQVVGRPERREVAGEVQVDVGHRHHLRVAAAGRAALHAEHRPHRRLPQAGHRLQPQPVQRVGETDRGRRLALPRRRRRDRGHQDQLAERAVGQRLQVAEVDLRLVVAVGHQVLGIDPQLVPRHPRDRVQLGRGGDLDVRQHSVSLLDDADAPEHSRPLLRVGQRCAGWTSRSSARSRKRRAPPRPPHRGRPASPGRPDGRSWSISTSTSIAISTTSACGRAASSSAASIAVRRACSSDAVPRGSAHAAATAPNACSSSSASCRARVTSASASSTSGGWSQ